MKSNHLGSLIGIVSFGVAVIYMLISAYTWINVLTLNLVK